MDYSPQSIGSSSNIMSDEIRLLLASKSPRRQSLIKELGFPVEIRIAEVEEIYPDSLENREVPEYLAKLKATPFVDTLNPGEVLVTSDTIVHADDKILGKPASREEAFKTLTQLSGKQHEVITGVCLTSVEKQHTFSTITHVHFSEISSGEIEHYISHFHPFDKAGSYAIQEWIGYIAVQKINGCYYNVVGLPLHDLYRALKTHFLSSTLSI